MRISNRFWAINLIVLMLIVLITQVALGQDAPLLKILDQFTAPDVPERGPSEPGPTTRTWWDPTTVPSTQPAPIDEGLAQHPMLYAGEGYNTLFLVNHGKIIWTYSSGKGGELDDTW